MNELENVDYKKLYEMSILELEKLEDKQYNISSDKLGYCHKCGLKLVNIMSSGFDMYTGKKNMELICSSGERGHYGIPCRCDYPLFSSRCRYCGEHEGGL